MRILVTGGAGFIGSHVQDAYVEEGHDVCVIDNLYTGKKEFVNPKSLFCEVDIRDRSAIERVFSDGRFDIVNHHAAQMDVRASVDDPSFDASINIMGGLNLLEASIRSGVKQFIFASTGGAIYGEQDYFPANENHPLRPESPYGVAKLSLERYLHYYERVHGLRYFVFRYANIYGERQNPRGEAGVVAIFSQKLVRGEAPTINGDGHQTRDFVHVSDVVEANLAATNFTGRGAIVNIGTGLETNINQIFERLASISGRRIDAIHGPAKKGEQFRSVLDNSVAKELLGWEPKTDLRRGLERTYAYFVEKEGVLV